MRELLLEIAIHGQAEPAGSKQARPIMRKQDGEWVPVMKNGRPLVNVVEDNPKSKGWKDQVAHAAGEAREGAPLVDGALAVELVFYRPRNKGDFGSGRNSHLGRDAAPARPTVRPDVLKLARAVEDALTGVVWRDDAQIVEERLEKHFGDPPRVEVRVWLLAEQTAADLPLDQRVRPGEPEPEPAPEQQTLVAA
jgi:Holliday junction resolvase RusA-like endonuclease